MSQRSSTSSMMLGRDEIPLEQFTSTFNGEEDVESGPLK